MSRTVAIVCRECAGSGDRDGVACGWCLGQGHEYVDRAFDGGPPVGTREWIPNTLGPTPLNPLQLATDAAPTRSHRLDPR